jgi:hypothetical protein
VYVRYRTSMGSHLAWVPAAAVERICGSVRRVSTHA